MINLSSVAMKAARMVGFGKQTAPTGMPLLDNRGKNKTKYSFADMMPRFRPTKKYVNGKLNTRKHEKYHQREGNSGRGALGARQRAVGVHWIKA